MAPEAELAPEEQEFLRALNDRLDGDTGGSVSMYGVGENLGMDRAASSRIAENLMGLGLVEIRTLSGAIGITPAGAERVGTGSGTAAGMGDGPLLDDSGRPHVESTVAELKCRIGGMGFDFDPLAELVADLQTIDAQLASPRPKTAILRACFQSIADVLSEAGAPEQTTRVRELLNT